VTVSFSSFDGRAARRPNGHRLIASRGKKRKETIKTHNTVDRTVGTLVGEVRNDGTNSRRGEKDL